MTLPSTTSLLTVVSAAALVLPALVLPAHAANDSSSEACFGFQKSGPSASQTTAANDRKAAAIRKSNEAASRRSRSTTKGFSWFGGQSSSNKVARNTRSTGTYPVVQRFGNTTTVKVNGAQRPAVIRHDMLSSGGSNQVIIDLADQRAYVFVNGQVAIDTPISTAAAGMTTPTGTYSITEKVRSGKISTIYHVTMPNWMRLGSTAVGMHTGYLPGYPASHGCVRLPGSVAPYIFDATRYGTRVEIHSAWNGSCERL
jgi:lipoprotein-anchoring transpeptidase ErfK/SrfK